MVDSPGRLEEEEIVYLVTEELLRLSQMMPSTTVCVQFIMNKEIVSLCYQGHLHSVIFINSLINTVQP